MITCVFVALGDATTDDLGMSEQPANVGPIDLGYDGGGRGDVLADQRCIQSLVGTRPWVMLFAVLLFIGGGFAALAIFPMGMFALTGPTGQSGPSVGFFALIAAVYLLIAAIYILLGVMLVRYFSAIGRLNRSRQTDDLFVSLEAQRKFWRLLGIIFIAAVVLYFVGIAFAIVFSVLA